MNVAFAILMLFAAGGSAIAAFLSWGVAKRAFEWQQRQNDPDIRVVVQPNHDSKQILMLIVENVGAGPAYDIKFEFSSSLPARAFGIEAPQGKKIEYMSSGALVDGIPGLGAGDKREIMWGQYGGLSAAIGEKAVTITARYKNRQQGECKSLSVVEIKSFEHTDASDNRPIAKIEKHLKKISDAIHQSSNGMRPLLFETTEMRQLKKEAMLEMYIKNNKDQQDGERQ